MLHLVNKSPHSHTSLENCIRFLSAGDVIVLIEDGIYAAKKGTNKSTYVEQIVKDHAVYVMRADLHARGVTDLIDGVQEIDYEGFVDLLVEHPSQTWR